MHRLAALLFTAGTALAQTCSYGQLEEYPRDITQKLPDPFTFVGGSKVRTRAEWECRQQQIAEQFELYELGDYPAKPDAVTGTLIGADIISVTVTVKGEFVGL